jgi:hypothetical protein
MFGGLIPLAILGLIIYAIVKATRGRTAAGVGDSVVSFRRLFEYALLLAALIVAASGLSGILARVIGGAAARRDTELAASLAMVSVGVPVFWGFGVIMWRRLAAATEQRSAAWSLYLNITLIGSVSFGAGYALSFTNELIDGDGYDGARLAPFVVACAVWMAHWIAWRLRPPTLAPLGHVYVGAAVGLVLAAIGGGWTLSIGIDRAFDSTVVARSGGGDDLARALAMFGIGGVIWSWHWLGNAIGARRDYGWHAYVLLVGVFGGVATAVTGAAFGIYLVLEWVFGDPGSVSAARHFEDLAPTCAAAVVGTALWLYHRAVLGLDPSRRRTEVDRIYDHIVAGVALVTMAVSLTILVVAVFEALGDGVAARDDASGVNRVLGAVTGLVVGAPIWLLGWGRALRAVRQRGEEEATSPTRRIYLLGVFGIGGAIAFGALIRLLVVVYENIFDEGRSSVGQGLRVPVALLVTVGTIAAYHWWVYRAERVEGRQRRDILLVWPAAALLPDLSERANLRINVLRSTGGDGSVPGAADILALIDATPGEHLLVVAGPEGAEALPLESG